MPWRLSEDLRHFKKLTTGENQSSQNSVLMGRKTWQSIPAKSRPLPGRRNIVLTRQVQFTLPSDVLRASDLDEAFESLEEGSQCFVIGGGEIYAQALANRNCNLLYVTEVDGDFDCDVFFPNYQNLFAEKECSEILHEGGTSYQFKLFQRR